MIFGGPAEANPTGGMLVAKGGALFEQNLVVSIEPVSPGETAKQYAQRQMDRLKKANAQRTDAAPAVEVMLRNAEPGLLLEQTVPGGPNGERLRQMLLVTIKNDVAYTLIATHLDGEVFERSRETLRKFLLSFE
jgi:hypothetical protein